MFVVSLILYSASQIFSLLDQVFRLSLAKFSSCPRPKSQAGLADLDYMWESLGALTADLAGMSADMAHLARRSSPSFLPSNDSVPQDGASPPPPPRETNSVPNVASQTLAQSASPEPPQDLDFRRLLLAKETQMIEVEKLKLQLELARIQASSNSMISDGSNPAKLHDPTKSLGDLRAPQRTLYPQQWPHILIPGESKLYNELALAEFTTGYLSVIEKCPDAVQKSLFLHHLADLMSLACSYQWSAVRVYHYKVLHTL